MPRQSGRHLSIEARQEIEEGIRDGRSAGEIARRVGVSPSTVTREVKANRTFRYKKARPGANLSVRCARRGDCSRAGTACEGCPTRLTMCRDCRTRQCVFSCPGFERRACPATERWPYVCPGGCPKRGWCGFPKASYRAADADAAYRERLSSSRSGVSVDEGQLAAMDAVVSPLVRKGHSFGAIWAAHGDEMPVGARTAYNYQAAGLFSACDLELPRKVRCRPRKRAAPPGAPRVDRSGRTYADFRALPLADRARVAQVDSVCGLEGNSRDLLSVMPVAAGFQMYLAKDHGSPAAVVAALDAIEVALGSPGAFEAALGVVLADRGVEFDDFEGMERSRLVPGARRCRVFYCDAMATNQKSECERNHEQLRRVLPKGRSDFDALSALDAAVLTSHVNSYPLAGRGGRCAFEIASGLLPRELLEAMGWERVPSDEVVLTPELLPHAVER